MTGRRRIERVNQLLRASLAELVRDELSDPRTTGVTFTHVETTPDLKHANVHVRTLTPDPGVDEAIEGLESAEGFIRHQLGKELRLRRIPELHFLADRSLEHVRRIDELLDEALGEEGADPGDDGS